MANHQNTLPNLSLLKNSKKPFDYIDSFNAELPLTKPFITIDEVAKAFFTGSPAWVSSLFALRNKLVGALGLKTSGNQNRAEVLSNFSCEVGDKLGLFRVFEKSDYEIIMGEDDSHLNFRVSLLLEVKGAQQILVISTGVQFNNVWGKLYFLPVKPFHKLVVPSMINGVIKKLEEERKP